MYDFDAQIPEMISLLKRLVEIESPSKDKIAVDRVGVLIAGECERLGAQVKVHVQRETGDHIEAIFAPSHNDDFGRDDVRLDGKGENKILILAHMDTVFPIGTLKNMPFFEKEGKVYGPGVSDMKGGIVVAIKAIAAAIENGSMPNQVTALFTSDEEIGSDTSRALIEEMADQAALVLVLEPGMVDGSVKTWRKGVGEYSVRVRGRAAHAGGDHEKGCNAIEELAHQVLFIQKLTDYDKGTTLNVGVIRGGIASNVVPDDASFEVDLRVMQPGEAERIDIVMQSLKPILECSSIEVFGGLNRPPMPYNDTIKATFEKIKVIAASEGIDLKASGTGGASDANFVAPLGIPLLDGLGPAGGEYHSEREYIFSRKPG